MPEPTNGHRPRVLHVLEALSTGCARHVLDLVENVEGYDHHVVVPTTAAADRADDPAIRSELEAAGATLHPVAMHRPPVHPGNAAAALRLRRLARDLHADVVHGHSSIAGALARVGAVGRRPVVYTPNGIATGKAARAIERLLGPLTTRFVAVSGSEAGDVRRLHLVPDARLVTIANGIATEVPEPLSLHEHLGLPPGTPLVGKVGRLSPQKAPEVYVAAAARIVEARPDVHVVLVGDGPQAPDVHAGVAAAGIGANFHHVPHLAHAARYLHSLDVFVLTSRFEGGPYAPLEAMRAGTPVVLTDVVGSRDTVVDGETGLLVPPDTPEATAAAVLSLLDDPDEAARIGRAGQRAMQEQFGVGTMAAAHRRLYDQLRARG